MQYAVKLHKTRKAMLDHRILGDQTSREFIYVSYRITSKLLKNAAVLHLPPYENMSKTEYIFREAN